MDRQEFINTLISKRIPSSLVCFDDLEGRDDIFWVRQSPLGWSVSYVERGQEYGCLGYPSESDALVYLLKRITDTYELLG